jgi:hypothetical protein
MAKVRDFFISYTGADVAWAEWVAQTLEDAGYTTVLQAWDFRPGDNFIQRMDQALADADQVVAVLSTAYFASEYTWDEWTAALVRVRGERDRLLPMRIEAVELPPLLAGRVYLDLVGLEEQTAAARLVAGVQPGRSSKQASGHTQVARPRRVRCRSRAATLRSSRCRRASRTSPAGAISWRPFVGT